MRLASIVLPLLLVAPALAGDTPPAAGAAAKKEKSKPAKPTKVYTDEDLKNAGQDGKGGKGTVTFLSEPQGQADSGAPAHTSPEGVQAGSSETKTVGDSGDEQPSSESGEGASAGELGWRARAREQRDAIKTAEKEIARLEAQLEELALDRQPSPADLLDPTRLQNREALKAETRAQIEAARANLVLARQALEDLENQARKAGVPQAWLEER